MGRPKAHADTAAKDQAHGKPGTATPSRPKRAAAEDTKARLAGRLAPLPPLPPPVAAQQPGTPCKAKPAGDAARGKGKDQGAARPALFQFPGAGGPRRVGWSVRPRAALERASRLGAARSGQTHVRTYVHVPHASERQLHVGNAPPARLSAGAPARDGATPSPTARARASRPPAAATGRKPAAAARKRARVTSEITTPDGGRLRAGEDYYVALENFDDDLHGGDDEAEACEACGSSRPGSGMLECGECLRGFHLRCLAPPLKRVPDGEWLCPQVRGGGGARHDRGAARRGAATVARGMAPRGAAWRPT